MSKLKEFNDWWEKRAGGGITMRSSEAGVIKEVIDKARSLLSDEQSQKPTADASLVGELRALANCEEKCGAVRFVNKERKRKR